MKGADSDAGIATVWAAGAIVALLVVAGLLYLIITLPLSQLVRWLERRTEHAR